MNKEIEELLNMLKKCARENKATLKLNEIACKTILLYIEQLENNRDKAIEEIENIKSKMIEQERYYIDSEIILEILRGKDENNNI